MKFIVSLILVLFSFRALAVNEWAFELEKLKADVAASDFDTAKCETRFSELHSRLLQLTADDIAPDRATRDVLRKDPTSWINEIFKARQLIRSKVLGLAANGGLSEKCLAYTRDVIRAGRIVEDMIGEFSILSKPPIVKPTEGGAPWMLRTDSGVPFAFKSGDVLVSRGNAFTSAAIARMSDIDAVFSHLAIVHIDPKTKKMTTVEAHIEIGSSVFPMQTYLGDGKARLLVLRHRDSALAARAADRIYEDVLTYQKEKKMNWPYDFSMDMSTDHEILCSELVSVAYSRASEGQMKLPMFPSTINMKNPDFLNRLGVKTKQSFMPGDIELDPRFDVVAEWRDFAKMHTNHMQDAVLTAMYRWMDRDGYILDESTQTRVTKVAAWHARRWPLFSNLLDEKFPKNMSQSVLGVYTTLNDVAEVIYARLDRENASYLKKTGTYMSPKQLHEILEAYRIEDFAKYKRKLKSEFHVRFHPKS